jgi:sugar phosphate isomerase/epimerase
MRIGMGTTSVLPRRLHDAFRLALAREVGASTVVMHPPYRWQRQTAAGLIDMVRTLQAASGVTVAVENTFPVTVRGRDTEAYAPDWNPGNLDIAALTLDFSHAALAGVSALDFARRHTQLLPRAQDGEPPGAARLPGRASAVEPSL